MKHVVGTEAQLYEQIARYLSVRHPELNGLWHFDLGGVNNPSRYTRSLYARINRRAWPDLFVGVPVLQPDSIYVYYGLFIELKREGFKLKKRDGSWVKEHIAEQAALLEELSGMGYVAVFGVGYDETVQIIESYLSSMQAGAA